MKFFVTTSKSPKQLKFTHSNFQENPCRRFSKRATSLFCLRKLLCHVLPKKPEKYDIYNEPIPAIYETDIS